jgi:hypothetical protein
MGLTIRVANPSKKKNPQNAQSAFYSIGTTDLSGGHSGLGVKLTTHLPILEITN